MSTSEGRAAGPGSSYAGLSTKAGGPVPAPGLGKLPQNTGLGLSGNRDRQGDRERQNCSCAGVGGENLQGSWEALDKVRMEAGMHRSSIQSRVSSFTSKDTFSYII